MTDPPPGPALHLRAVSERGLQRFAAAAIAACPGVVRRLLRCSQCLICLTAYRGHLGCGLRPASAVLPQRRGLHCFELAVAASTRLLAVSRACWRSLSWVPTADNSLETLDFRSRHRLSVSSGLLSLGRTPHGFFDALGRHPALARGVERILCLLVLDLELFDGIPVWRLMARAPSSAP